MQSRWHGRAKSWINQFWFIAPSAQQPPPPDSHGDATENPPSVQRFLQAMQTTAEVRFAASVRLKQKSKAYFITSTIFSLGLILIALLQLTEAKVAFSSQMLTAMTTFLAVAVLVYSVTAGTAHYEVRAEQLNECGDRLKNLIRTLTREIDYQRRIDEQKIADYEYKYHLIVTDTEPHNRNDYRRVRLDRSGEGRFEGRQRILELFKYYFFKLLEFMPHIALLSIELVFLLDMLGYTTALSPLHKKP